MRRGLLIVSVVVFACGKPPPPPSTNRSPAIADPRPDSPVATGNGPTCIVTFTALAEDPDLNDTLVARFYVDDFGKNANPAREIDVPPSGGVRRELQISLAESIGSATNPLHSGGTHLVELLLSDGVLEGREPQPRSRLSDGSQIPTFAVTYAWDLNVEQGKDCN
jgi:hypothetical protein